jgi:hypothetical protein
MLSFFPPIAYVLILNVMYISEWKLAVGCLTIFYSQKEQILRVEIEWNKDDI